MRWKESGQEKRHCTYQHKYQQNPPFFYLDYYASNDLRKLVAGAHLYCYDQGKENGWFAVQ